MSKMLSSWKEIAHFFGKGVRTVQRWEKTLDLPIHRPPGAPSNVVLARTSDLEEWMHRGQAAGALTDTVAEAATSPLLADALASLEREITSLANRVGLSVEDRYSIASPVERIDALASTLNEVNERLTSSRTSRAA